MTEKQGQQAGGCLSESEAARLLGVSRVTLLRARQRGEIRHYRVGARVTYEPEFLRDLYHDKIQGEPSTKE